MRKYLFKVSRLVHKYAGLAVIIYAVLMAASGVLLNHPEWISSVYVPQWLLPAEHRLENWNRGAARKLVLSSSDPSRGYLAGRLGVWETRDGCGSFSRFGDSFPPLPGGRTNDVLLLEGERELLLAGTMDGLYYCDTDNGSWHKAFIDDGNQEIRKILPVKDRLIVFTSNGAFSSPLPFRKPEFSPAVLTAANPSERRIGLVTLFFDLHGCTLWGVPGSLLLDICGLAIVFVSLSSICIWLYPGQRRRGRLIGNSRSLYRFLFRYHLKIGIVTAVLMFFFALTGLLLLKPPVKLLVGKTVPRAAYPGKLPDNPFHSTIKNAIFDQYQDKLIVQAGRSFWSGPVSLEAPFERIKIPVPLSGMGANVFEAGDNGDWLIGSFRGIYRLSGKDGSVTSLITGNHISGKRVEAADIRWVTGYLDTGGGNGIISTHRSGILTPDGSPGENMFHIPGEMGQAWPMPLWDYLFLFHKGSLFRAVLGPWNASVFCTLAVMFLLVIVSGTWDWLYPRWPGKN